MTSKEILDKAAKNCPYENAECVIYRSGYLEGYIECLKDLGQYDVVYRENNTED